MQQQAFSTLRTSEPGSRCRRLLLAALHEAQGFPCGAIALASACHRCDSDPVPTAPLPFPVDMPVRRAQLSQDELKKQAAWKAVEYVKVRRSTRR